MFKSVNNVGAKVLLSRACTTGTGQLMYIHAYYTQKTSKLQNQYFMIIETFNSGFESSPILIMEVLTKNIQI